MLSVGTGRIGLTFVRYRPFFAGHIALLFVVLLSLSSAWAEQSILPSDGDVKAGSVSFETTDNALTITQGSSSAIINWNTFSIGSGNVVTFVQPSASSSILNRVTGDTSSTIAGSLTANGQVYLINPNGILITASGNVDVGAGFVASSLDIDNEDYLNGNLTFLGDGASASVENRGIITLGREGYAALIGGRVNNEGLIYAPLGKIGLGSGEKITLDLSGDGFLQVTLPNEDQSDEALIKNTGSLKADGGEIIIKAATAREAVRNAINLSGVVQAKSVSGHNGSIVIGGGEGGSVKLYGKIEATSSSGKGGNIEVSGQSIELEGAELDASGSTGGGTILIGGQKHGAEGLQTAETTNVDADTIIRADATEDGDGGEIVIWSDESTTFSGLITAHGAGGGAGGNAEVSGKQVLVYAGFSDLSADNGKYGTLLLDPYDITIIDDNSAGTSFTASETDSTLNVNVLITQLGSANVEISTGSSGSQLGNITIGSAISWSANTILTLSAENNIYFNANVNASGASAGLVLNYNGDYTIDSGSSITLSGASATLEMNGTSYTLIHSMAELDDIDTTGLDSNYALAIDLDATGTTYTESLVGLSDASSYTGTFAGLGHVISNLTIENANASGPYGLFGWNKGTIRDIGIENASFTISTTGTDSLYVGLLAGYSREGAISSAYSTGSLIVSGAGNVYAGGLVGDNYTSSISNSYSSVNVTGTGASAYIGGLVGISVNYASVTSSYASGNVYANATGAGYVYAGGLVGDNYYATIDYSYATGDIITDGGGNSAFAGGLAGWHDGMTISYSYATGAVSITNAYSANAGGLVGESYSASVNYAYSTGAVTITNSSYAYAGGLHGYLYLGSAQNVYSSSSITISGTDYVYVGGLLGNSSNASLSYAYATGAISVTDDVWNLSGGILGSNSGSTILAAYFDSDTTGLSQAVGSGDDTGIVGLGTDDFQNTAYFQSLASTDGWDFDTIWAPSSEGYYPEFYVLSAVVRIDNIAANMTYGDASFASYSDVVYGGSSLYLYAEENDSIDFKPILTNIAKQDYGAGSHTLNGGNTSIQSEAGTTYRVVYSGVLEIDKAPLTITIDDASKTYGETASLIGYAITGLLGSDSVTNVTLISDGAEASADVGAYAINASGVSGSGISNYDITYDVGTLTVNKASLTITASDASKTYGTSLNLTDFTSSGLVNDNEIESISLASSGALAGADVGLYAITANNASGTGLANYIITYKTGTLTVGKATLTITPDNVSKTYGQSISLNAYAMSGLVSGDEITNITLSSDGAEGGANAGEYAIIASDVAGFDTSNYEIIYETGQLSVEKATLIITALDMSKTYGDEIALSEYQSEGLVNDDTITGLTLTSEGANASAAAGSYEIKASQAEGSGISNYFIRFVSGLLSVKERISTLTAGLIASNSDSPEASDTNLQDETALELRSAISMSASDNETDSGDAGQSILTEDPRLSGPICFAGTNNALICGHY